MLKVSVIVPVYNVEDYLPKCLDSLVNQTIDNYEVIVVNDGSPDNSQEIIDRYAKEYPQIIKPFIKENGGLSDARNFGIKKASGEYIAFVDSDDYVDIDMYELMYNKAKETNSDVVNCAYSHVIDRTVHRNYYGGSMRFFGKSVAESPKILRYANSIACNKIFRREFWLNNNFEFPVGQWFEDSALIYNVMGSANKVECVNIPFYYYVKTREDSITNTVDERIFDIFKSVKSIVEFYNKFPQSPELQEEITYLCLRHTLARAFKFDKKVNKKMSRKFLDACYDFFESNLPNWRESRFVKASKKAKRSTKRIRFIRRHRTLAKIYYVGTILKSLEKAAISTIKAVKNLLKSVNTSHISAEERLEQINERKRNAIQTNGVAVMCLVQRLLKEIGILSFADFGTMLGIVREGRLLAHDLDMDMGVIIKKKTDMDRIRLHLEKFGFAIWRQYIFDDNIVEESYRFCGIKVDLNYYVITDTESKTWLFYREPDVEYPDNTRNIVEMTYSPITEFKTVKMQGEDVCIPANAEQLLLEKYGPTWRTPDKGWIYWLSPAATKIPNIGYYIDYRYKRATEVNEEWYNKVKAAELEANRKYQLKQLEILKAIQQICENNNIIFTLAKSTLRFAEYYGKLAPWETNLFLAMTKDNYDKFLNIAQKELSDDLVLQHSSTVENYWLPYIVVRSKDNSEFYQENIENLTEFNGPCVRILPLCYVPQLTSEQQKNLAKEFRFYKKALAYKSGISAPKTNKDKHIKNRSNLLSYRYIHKQIDNIYNTFSQKDCEFVVSLADSTKISKTTLPKEYFENPEFIEFENMTMPVPRCADEVLEKRYGYNYAKSLSWKKRQIKKSIVHREKE
ncbi:MAG: glycosyltransferase [Clostridia bacterium]|nr:glycosyltransferase [Clostridia bacterium]